jgi:hypothetical protein
MRTNRISTGCTMSVWGAAVASGGEVYVKVLKYAYAHVTGVFT